MATQTMSVRRVMESRPHDYAYDPLITSAAAKASIVHRYRQQTGIPAWNNSFPTTTRSGLLGSSSSLSSTALSSTLPDIDSANRLSHLVASHDAPSHASLLQQQHTAAGTFDGITYEITGKDRIKFIKRPLVPFLQAVMPDHISSSSSSSSSSSNQALNDVNANNSVNSASSSANGDNANGTEAVGATRTVAQQTDYRESETQTDPFTPDYITSAEEAEPEILGLSHLTYGNGLPASLAEVEYIHRLRSKVQFEASLPPLSDFASFERRKQLLEARELAEWKLREMEMKAEQEERMNMLIDKIKEREEAVDERANERIEKIRQEKTKEKEHIFKEIHKERIKAHRSLAKHRQQADAATGRMLGPDFAPPPPHTHSNAHFLYPSPSILSVQLPPSANANNATGPGLTASSSSSSSSLVNPLTTATLNAKSMENAAAVTQSLFGATAFAPTTSSSSSLTRDIVGDYVDHGSRVYAPVSREGRLPVVNNIVDYGIPLLSSFQGLEALEKSILRQENRVKLKQDQVQQQQLRRARQSGHAQTHGQNGYVPLPDTRSSSVRRAASIVARDLAYVDSLLHAANSADGVNGSDSMTARTRIKALTSGLGSSSLIENVYKKFEPVVRAPTPSVVEPVTHEAERAVLLLQRLLRGRRVQNDMYQGTHHHRHLIAELRIDEETEPQQCVQLCAYDETPLDSSSSSSSSISPSCGLLVGEVFSSTVDFVSKELVRSMESGNISSLVFTAAQTRRHRECEETGKRQSEEELRAKRTQIMQSIMKQHRETARTVVNGWMTEAVEQHAHRDALHTSNVKQAYLEPVIGVVEDDMNDADTIIGDLVGTFLLPEVARRIHVNYNKMQARRLQNAAHSAAKEAIKLLQDKE